MPLSANVMYWYYIDNIDIDRSASFKTDSASITYDHNNRCRDFKLILFW